MTSAIVAVSLLASLAWASVLPSEHVEGPYGGRSHSSLGPLDPRGIETRSDLNKTFHIGWQIQDQPLFSANWTGATGYVPIGGVVPIEASATESYSLSVQCNDCRTFGNILADFNDDAGLNMSLTFNNVGVHMDFGVFASRKGTFTIGLGRFFGKKPYGQNINGIFNATVGIGIDLVLSFTGDVKATGGFQIAIPDREKIGLTIDLLNLDDLLAGRFNVTAELDLVPEVNFAVLPIQPSRASANITAAIVLRAEAGIGLQKTPLTQNIDFSAIASASVTLAQLTFGDVITDGKGGSCKQALFIDVESNAAAQAVVGGEIAGREFEYGPDVSTVFLSAGTTSCLDRRTDITGLVKPTVTSEPSSLIACPTSALVTQTRDVTKTLSVTSCFVSAMNCPNSLTQVVVVTEVKSTTVTTCLSSLGITTGTPTVAPVTFYAAGSLTLPPLKSPVVTSIASSLLANLTVPLNATVVGVAITVPVLTTTPPEVTAPLVIAGGRNATRSKTATSNSGAATAKVRVSWDAMSLQLVLLGFIVLL